MEAEHGPVAGYSEVAGDAVIVVPVIVERLASGARGAAGPVRAIGLAGVAAGLVIWLVWLIPSSFVVWKVVLSALSLLVLVVPGAVVLLFHAGLSELIGLPEKFVRLAEEGRVHATTAYRNALDIPTASGNSRLRRVARLIQSLFAARGALTDSYGTVMSVALAGRLLHPISLIAVVAAIVLTGLLCLVAVVAGMTVIF